MVTTTWCRTPIQGIWFETSLEGGCVKDELDNAIQGDRQEVEDPLALGA